jgi:hypothetical protein
MKMPKTPELDRMAEVRDKSQAIGEFIENSGFTLGKWVKFHGITEERFTPASGTIEQILADYFEIDLRKVDCERRAIIDALNAEPRP